MNNTIDFKKNIGKNTVYVYLSRVIATIFSGIIFIYISRSLNLSDYGLYSLFSSILIFYAIILPLGFPTSMLRFIPEIMENKKIETLTYLIKRCLLIIFCCGGLFLIFVFCLQNDIGRLFNNAGLRNYLPVLTIIGIFTAQNVLFESVANSLFLQKNITLYELITAVIQLSLVVLFLKGGYGLFGLVLAMVVAGILLFLLYFNKMANIVSHANAHPKDKSIVKRFFKYSLKDRLFIITGYFWDVTVDIYIIAYLLGSSAAGLFGFAAFMSLFLRDWMPGYALQNLIRPLFVKIYTKNNSKDDLRYLFRFYNKFKAFFVFPVITGMWLLIDKIILFIFSPNFLPAAGILRVLLFFIMLQSFLRPINNMFSVLEKNEIPLYTNIVILYRLAASFLLIKYFGIQAAAWAFGSSILLIFFIQYFCLRKILQVEFPYSGLLRIAFNSLVMGGVIFLLRNKITNLISLIFVIALGAAVYAAMSYFNKAFRENERSLLNSVAGIKVWHF